MFSMICREMFSNVKNFTYKRNPEDDICMKFADQIRQMQMLGITEKFVWTHVANEYAGKRRHAFGSALRAKGKITGWPDYIFLCEGGSIAIEFKAGKNKQSASQKLVNRWFDAAGVPYYVCYSEGAAMDVLKKHGLMPK